MVDLSLLQLKTLKIFGSEWKVLANSRPLNIRYDFKFIFGIVRYAANNGKMEILKWDYDSSNIVTILTAILVDHFWRQNFLRFCYLTWCRSRYWAITTTWTSVVVAPPKEDLVVLLLSFKAIYSVRVSWWFQAWISRSSLHQPCV